jgi:transglutaminase-like putative cysteine protease
VRLNLTHNTVYSFARPVAFNPHRLVLRPQCGADLQVLSHDLDIMPDAELSWSTDVFGNLIATAQFAVAADRLSFTSRLVIDEAAPDWPVFPIAAYAQKHPFHHSLDEAIDLGALRASDGDSSVAMWAKSFVAGPGTDTLSLLQDINHGVAAVVAYTPRAEEGTQRAEFTLRCRTGSCRDMAELYLSAVRTLGFGARAVSGYLVDPGRTGGADATHAWVEVYLPGASWITFDPTNARMGAAGLVKVAVGRRSAQVLPITGSYVGQPEDAFGIEVAVRCDRLCSPPTSLSLSQYGTAHADRL